MTALEINYLALASVNACNDINCLIPICTYIKSKLPSTTDSTGVNIGVLVLLVLGVCSPLPTDFVGDMDLRLMESPFESETFVGSLCPSNHHVVISPFPCKRMGFKKIKFKVRKHDKFRRDCLNIRTNKSSNGTRPGVRTSKRLLFASRTRSKCSMFFFSFGHTQYSVQCKALRQCTQILYKYSFF